MVGPPRMSLSIHFTSDLLTVLGGASAPNSLRYEEGREVGPKLPSSGVCASSSSPSRFEFNCFFLLHLLSHCFLLVFGRATSTSTVYTQRLIVCRLPTLGTGDWGGPIRLLPRPLAHHTSLLLVKQPINYRAVCGSSTTPSIGEEEEEAGLLNGHHHIDGE